MSRLGSSPSGKPRKPNISVPLMTDYGFGVSEEGRIIHFKADGAEKQENKLPHEKERELETIELGSFEEAFSGKQVAGGCNGQHPSDKVVIDKSETSIKGHVGLKCLACHVGWIVKKSKTPIQ